MTSDAIITVLITLGMSLEKADSSLDTYCQWWGELPSSINHIKYIWKLYGPTK